MATTNKIKKKILLHAVVLYMDICCLLNSEVQAGTSRSYIW